MYSIIHRNDLNIATCNYSLLVMLAVTECLFHLNEQVLDLPFFGFCMHLLAFYQFYVFVCWYS